MPSRRHFAITLFSFTLIAAACATEALAQEKGIGDFPKLSAATDWPWWRGPSRDGKATDTPVPTKLSDKDNRVWKVKVPGRGHSSPIVVGDKIFLTTADEAKKTHAVLAFDRAKGKAAVERNRQSRRLPGEESCEEHGSHAVGCIGWGATLCDVLSSR